MLWSHPSLPDRTERLRPRCGRAATAPPPTSDPRARSTPSPRSEDSDPGAPAPRIDSSRRKFYLAMDPNYCQIATHQSLTRSPDGGAEPGWIAPWTLAPDARPERG